MKDEIKEILEKLNKIVPYASVPKELAYMTTNITPQECKTLLDYITNLQEQLDKEKIVKKKAIEYLPEIRKTSSYELDEKIDNLENILNGEK